MLEVVLHWVDAGVKVFRGDTPHTKPFAFWESLIKEVHARDRDVVFLAEAFTRRAVMRHLAKLGFSQSYTYFTWKNSRHELTEYISELAYSGEQEYFRPNFFVNTPDILHAYLQPRSRPAFEPPPRPCARARGWRGGGGRHRGRWGGGGGPPPRPGGGAAGVAPRPPPAAARAARGPAAAAAPPPRGGAAPPPKAPAPPVVRGRAAV